MWKVLLGFIVHRLVLIIIALGAINYSLNQKTPSQGRLPRIEATSVLVAELASRLRLVTEVETAQTLSALPLKQVFSANRHPFYWCVRIWGELTHMSPIASVVLLSNILFLLFLFETFILLSRMVLLETATWGTLLILFFPSSYEISMGSALSITLCLTAIALRRALDNQWFLTGLAVGVMALGDWIVIGWVPLLIYLFWYYQQHFQMVQVVKRVCFFFIPLVLAIVVRWDWYAHAFTSVAGSAFVSLIHSPNEWMGAILSTHAWANAGPILSVLIFLVGAILCFASHTTWLNRLVPLYSVLVVLAYSSVANVTMRLLLAGMALAGIAHVSSGTLARILSAIFTLLTGAELIRIFSVA
ncbi:MAG: hypothetical protein HYR96_00265 [Deltaproteobacteria bacterium]|nr:hypothetical protein [Deltaproteobacteria bacterium]MBI3293398.1 hypothetical protein [Deltaproteobacteria bacterium]